jgi:uncharacterized protein YrrD
MLHDMKDLLGSSVLAIDGEMGHIHNVLFDDRSWAVRYLVVDVAKWLEDRQEVVLAIPSVGQPDWTQRCVNVKLTKEQVRNSPNVDTKKPVTRQMEIAMRDYFYPSQGWIDVGFGTGPILVPEKDYPVNTENEDPHLRSVEDLSNYAVCATGGEIGRLLSFIMDEVTWHLGYLEVKAGSWLHHKNVLIPTRWVKSISWGDRKLNLEHTREGT